MFSFRRVIFFITLGLPTMVWADAGDNPLKPANDLYHQQQWDQAAQKYQEVLQRDPRNWQAYQGLGNCYYRLRKVNEAHQAYNQSLAMHPDNPPLQKFVNSLPPLPSPPASNFVPPPSTPVSGQSTAPMPLPRVESYQAGPLPKQGSIALNFGGAGWLASFQDIQDFFGAKVNSTQVPYGVELDLGADYTLVPSLQVGLQAQGLLRIPENLSFASRATQQWDVNALGGALVAKYLIPVQNKWNLILHLEGGYYTLVGSLVEGGGSVFGTVNLNSSNFGGLAAVEGEFIQDKKKSLVVDIGVGYRLLTMDPIAISGAYNDVVQTGNLLNYKNKNAYLDLSGLRLNATIRFY